MEKKEIDWAVLKGAVIVLGISIMISSSLFAGSYYFNSKLNKELKQNKNIFQSISRRYLDVDQEAQLLKDYYPQFVELYNKGVIGREKRLNWIDALRQSGEKIKLPELRYSINSQEEFNPEYPVNYNGYVVYRSSMELSIGLSHEGDLFKLLEHIDQTADGSYTISECTFNRYSNEIKIEKNAVNIRALCMLYWITIDLAGGNRIEIG